MAKLHKMRCPVRFWDESGEDNGFTSELSDNGVFIECRKPRTRGARLHLEIDSKGRSFFVEGEVTHVVD